VIPKNAVIPAGFWI